MRVSKAGVKRFSGVGKGAGGSCFERLRAVADLHYDDSADDAADWWWTGSPSARSSWAPVCTITGSARPRCAARSASGRRVCSIVCVSP